MGFVTIYPYTYTYVYTVVDLCHAIDLCYISCLPKVNKHACIRYYYIYTFLIIYPYSYPYPPCQVGEEHVSSSVVKIDINQPMATLRETLSALPVTTRLSLTGSKEIHYTSVYTYAVICCWMV